MRALKGHHEETAGIIFAFRSTWDSYIGPPGEHLGEVNVLGLLKLKMALIYFCVPSS